jgi:hypothetical protein
VLAAFGLHAIVSNLSPKSDGVVFVCRTGIKGEHDAKGKLMGYDCLDEVMEDPRERLRIFAC